MNGQELFNERERIKSSLNASITRFYDNGIDWAEKRRKYMILRAETELKFKDSGTQITIIKDLAKGDKNVAQAEFDMNVAEITFRASDQNIMAQKKLLESVEADIKREYYKE